MPIEGPGPICGQRAEEVLASLELRAGSKKEQGSIADGEETGFWEERGERLTSVKSLCTWNLCVDILLDFSDALRTLQMRSSFYCSLTIV